MSYGKPLSLLRIRLFIIETSRSALRRGHETLSAIRNPGCLRYVVDFHIVLPCCWCCHLSIACYVRVSCIQVKGFIPITGYPDRGEFAASNLNGLGLYPFYNGTSASSGLPQSTPFGLSLVIEPCPLCGCTTQIWSPDLEG